MAVKSSARRSFRQIKDGGITISSDWPQLDPRFPRFSSSPDSAALGPMDQGPGLVVWLRARLCPSLAWSFISPNPSRSVLWAPGERCSWSEGSLVGIRRVLVLTLTTDINHQPAHLVRIFSLTILPGPTVDPSDTWNITLSRLKLE